MLYSERPIGYNTKVAEAHFCSKEPRMITLTDTAVDKVRELIEMQQKDGSGLRVYVAGGGCSGLRYGMMLEDTPDEDDDVLDFGGLPVYVDVHSSQYLAGAHVDYVETVMGAGFKVDNPNAVSSCGCGSSFSTQQAAPAATAGGCGCG
jgi:iron-sulfur cluster assembly accessory protein